MSYNMIDRFLRNNLDDDDYEEFSAALDSLCNPQRKQWVGLEPEDFDGVIKSDAFEAGAYWATNKLKEKNSD